MGRLVSCAVEIPCGEAALSFDLDWAAECGLEIVFDEPVSGFGDLYSVGFSVGFHSAGCVNGVTPDIVLEFAGSNYARDRGSRVDAEPETQTCGPGVVQHF